MLEWTTLLEGAVLMCSTATMTVSIWSLWHSHLDHRIVTKFHMNGVKRLTVTARLIRDVSRAACAGILMTASFISLQVSPSSDPMAILFKITVSLVALLLGIAVFADWRWRMRIDEALDALELQLRP